MTGPFNEVLRGYSLAQLKFLQEQDSRRTIPASPRNESMSQDKTESENLPVISGDGFDDIDVSNRLIQGTILRCVDGHWSDRDKTPIPPDKTLVVLGTATALQHWHNGMPTETIVKHPGAALPDVAELNAKIPESQWEEGLDGDPRPPWVKQFIVYLLDPTDASVFTYVNSTMGRSSPSSDCGIESSGCGRCVARRWCRS